MSDRPTAPAWLSDAGRGYWAQVVGDRPQLRSADSDALGAYCEALARWIEADRLARQGPLIQRGEEVRPNPAVSIARAASAEVRAWARELGMTPLARATMGEAEEAYGVGGVVAAAQRIAREAGLDDRPQP